jgi:hypothetical protein
MSLWLNSLCGASQPCLVRKGTTNCHSTLYIHSKEGQGTQRKLLSKDMQACTAGEWQHMEGTHESSKLKPEARSWRGLSCMLTSQQERNLAFKFLFHFVEASTCLSFLFQSLSFFFPFPYSPCLFLTMTQWVTCSTTFLYCSHLLYPAVLDNSTLLNNWTSPLCTLVSCYLMIPTSHTFPSPLLILLISSSHYFHFLRFNAYANNFYFPNTLCL